MFFNYMITGNPPFKTWKSFLPERMHVRVVSYKEQLLMGWLTVIKHPVSISDQLLRLSHSLLYWHQTKWIDSRYMYKRKVWQSSRLFKYEKFCPVNNFSFLRQQNTKLQGKIAGIKGSLDYVWCRSEKDQGRCG